MMTGEIKKRCADELSKFCTDFQERRAAITDETVELFMSRRPLKWRGSDQLAALASRPKDGAAAGEGEGDGKMTKNQLKKLEKQRQTAEKKAAKASGKTAAPAGDAPAATEEAATPAAAST